MNTEVKEQSLPYTKQIHLMWSFWMEVVYHRCRMVSVVYDQEGITFKLKRNKR